MNIIIRNEYRVEALMSTYELDGFGIKYEDIDYGNIETRRFLWTLLDEIRKTYGINFSFAGKHLIEVIKENDDKYRICFSALPPHGEDNLSVKQLVKSEEVPVIAQFNTFEDVLTAVSILQEDVDASFYESNGQYRLILKVLPDEKNLLQCRIREFSDVIASPEVNKARTEEIWSCIISEKAVKKLKQTFSMSR